MQVLNTAAHVLRYYAWAEAYSRLSAVTAVLSVSPIRLHVNIRVRFRSGGRDRTFYMDCQQGTSGSYGGQRTPFAALTSERQKVQLPTEGHLAMSANCFYVSD